LLSNALKYSPAGAPIEVSAQVSGEFVQAAVADRGIGLKGSDSQLFEPFYRESDVVSGLGIGLAVCRRLVEAQHGQIQASARKGGGSIFSFTLPLAARAHT
jgi:two-component system sensor histidine kinase KdpD